MTVSETERERLVEHTASILRHILSADPTLPFVAFEQPKLIAHSKGGEKTSEEIVREPIGVLYDHKLQAKIKKKAAFSAVVDLVELGEEELAHQIISEAKG